MTTIAFKALKAGGISPYLDFHWPLPTNGQPGEWVHAEGAIGLCANGIHACLTCRDLLAGEYLDEELYTIELDGEIVRGDDKCCARSGRLLRRLDTWNEQTARLFAADCAESVGHLHPIVAPTVRIARRYAFGLATDGELADAGAAAGAAAGDAARAAARAAAGAAAWAAAWAAARAAARDAARAAAWAAARRSAARAAAGDALALRLHAYLTGSVDLDAIRESVEIEP